MAKTTENTLEDLKATQKLRISEGRKLFNNLFKAINQKSDDDAYKQNVIVHYLEEYQHKSIPEQLQFINVFSYCCEKFNQFRNLSEKFGLTVKNNPSPNNTHNDDEDNFDAATQNTMANNSIDCAYALNHFRAIQNDELKKQLEHLSLKETSIQMKFDDKLKTESKEALELLREEKELASAKEFLSKEFRQRFPNTFKSLFLKVMLNLRICL